jgi:hypothetical protein
VCGRRGASTATRVKLCLVASADAWVGVIGAVGGVTVTGTLALATAWLNHRWEREEHGAEHVREQSAAQGQLRREAYSRYLVAMNTLSDRIGVLDRGTLPEDVLTDGKKAMQAAMRGPLSTEWGEAADSSAVAELVAGDSVHEALDEFTNYVGVACENALSPDADTRATAFEHWSMMYGAMVDAMRREQSGMFSRDAA